MQVHPLCDPGGGRGPCPLRRRAHHCPDHQNHLLPFTQHHHFDIVCGEVMADGGRGS